MLTDQTSLCGVIGSPISHSLSPALHQAAYEFLGLDWSYTAHDVTADQVGEFVAGLSDQWRGLSCTMPTKRAIVTLGQPDPVVERLGVGNTVIFDGHPNDPATTRIANTDVVGVLTTLRSHKVTQINTAVIFGSGATARSIVFALADMRVERVIVKARSIEKANRLAGEIGRWGFGVISAEPIDYPMLDCDLAISTVPSTALAPHIAAIADHAQAVFDVLYDPWPTDLIIAAEKSNRVAITGLDLLCHQAVGQIELMTGQLIPVEVLLETARDIVKSRAS
jgi:shikimate dehydrogenase